MGVTHGVGGLAAGLAVGFRWGTSPGVALACGAAGCLAAAVPDTDHPKGAIPRMLGKAGWLVTSPVRTVSKLLTGIAHRGITHSLVCAGATGALVWFVLDALGSSPAEALAVGLAAFVGVCAALAGDAISHAGLSHLLWPLPFRFRLPKWIALKVGGPGELLLVWPASLAAVGWTLYLITTRTWPS